MIVERSREEDTGTRCLYFAMWRLTLWAEWIGEQSIHRHAVPGVKRWAVERDDGGMHLHAGRLYMTWSTKREPREPEPAEVAT